MLRILLLISLFLSSLTLVESTSATVVTYTPGAMIAMTGTSTWVAGTNTSVRFDIASILMSESSTESAPALITASKTFTGTFYGSGIGWIVFASGSNQVSLDCGTQSLSDLKANCTLTGTGWSENVGDIYFSSGTTITYDPHTGRLSGSAITFAGNISLTDIVLPLMPVVLNESTLGANHAATLSMKDAWMYSGSGGGWKGSVNAGIDIQSITSLTGTYTVDFSLANTYTVTIEDPNGSKTEMTGFVVNPDTLTTTLTAVASYHAATFCSAATLPDLNCPDDATRSATTLVQVLPAGAVANGTDIYTLTLGARDQYGNRIKSGNIKIKYQTTVKNIQTDITENINYSSIDGDAFISSALGSGLAGSAEKTFTLSAADITYTIASTAPTDTNNKIQLNSIEYNGGADIALSEWKTALNFVPLFVANVTTDTPTINTPHTFQTTITKNGTTAITPTIITTMQIGDGSMAEWRSLTSSPIANCSNYPLTLTTDTLCDWSNVSSIATTSVSGFAYTGTYTTWLPDAPSELTTMTGYIYYKYGATDVLYGLPTSSIPAATTASQRVRILGQSGEGVGGGARTRVDLINSIRKQVALLSRNRVKYDDVEYVVYTGDHRITPTDLNGDTGIPAKRTIIVIGGDITIDDKITLRDHPLVLIALTDSAGKGGNIKIKGTVRYINSSLIAEHGITSERSDLQLYIHGSLVSANPPREIAPTSCPYFAPPGCTRSDYDLPGSRDGYAALADKTSNQSTGGKDYASPLVIEADPRLMRDPGPAMGR